MTDPDPVLEPFDALVGSWATVATHPSVDAVVTGAVSWEWLEGGRFLIQRSRHEHPDFPDAIAVIGAPEAGGGLVLEYFDSRGVRRTYGVSLEDGVLRQWRDDPAFAQRYAATLDAEEFVGQWQLARAGRDFEDDVRVLHRRQG